MSKYLQVFVYILLLGQVAARGQVIQKNEQIDPKVKATVTELNMQVHRAMGDNNYDALSAMFTDTLKMSMGQKFQQQFMPNMSHIMKGNPYRIFDEFYIKDTRYGDTVVLASGSGSSAYTIKTIVKGTETYVVILVAGDSVNEIMLTTSWCNTKGKWQLFFITGEDYSLKKKTALGFYTDAQRLEKKGYLIDAVCMMSMSTHCAKPGGKLFSYAKETEMTKYADTLSTHTKAKYPFPYTLEDVPTKPSVVNVHYRLDSADFVPMIVYQSVINVADSNATQKENMVIQKKIGKIFPGMDKDHKKLYYRVYNMLPNGQNDPPYFGYTQRLQQ